MKTVLRIPVSRGSAASEFIGRVCTRPSSSQRCVSSIASSVASRMRELRSIELRNCELRSVASALKPSPKSTLSRALLDLQRAARLEKSQRITERLAKSGDGSSRELSFRVELGAPRVGSVPFRVN